MRRALLIIGMVAAFAASFTFVRQPQASTSLIPDTFNVKWFVSKKEFTAACVMAAVLSGEGIKRSPRHVTDWCGSAALNISQMFWPPPSKPKPATDGSAAKTTK